MKGLERKRVEHDLRWQTAFKNMPKVKALDKIYRLAGHWPAFELR
jgi:hypothetical protein